MRTRLILFIMAIVFVLNVYVYLSGFGGEANAAVSNILYILPPLLASVVGMWTVSAYGIRNVHGRSLTYLTAGIISWLIGEVIWMVMIFIYQIEPFPSVPDVFFLAGYLLVLVGVVKEFLLHKSSLRNFNKLLLFLIALVSVLIAFLIAYFGVYAAYDPEAPLLNNVVGIGYSVFDLLIIVPSLFVLKMALSFKGGKLFFSWMLAFVAMLLFLAADILFAIYYEPYNNLVFPYILIDLIWVTAYLFFTYSFYHTGDAIRQIQAKLIKK